MEEKGYRLRGSLHSSAKALKANPEDLGALQQRALALLAFGRNDEAIAIYSLILRKDWERAGDCLRGRAHAYQQKGEYAKAIAEYEETLLITRDPLAREALAWLLATCPDPELRDGKRALEIILKTVFFGADGHSTYPPAVDTAAAAYAETGDFEHAIALERQLVDSIFLTGKAREAAKSRLALYEAHRPYHAKDYSFPDFR